MRLFKILAPYKQRSSFQKKTYYINGYSLVDIVPPIFTFVNTGLYTYSTDIYIVDIDYYPESTDTDGDKFLTLRGLVLKQLKKDKFL